MSSKNPKKNLNNFFIDETEKFQQANHKENGKEKKVKQIETPKTEDFASLKSKKISKRLSDFIDKPKKEIEENNEIIEKDYSDFNSLIKELQQDLDLNHPSQVERYIIQNKSILWENLKLKGILEFNIKGGIDDYD